MIKLLGEVIHETEKAILFKVEEDICLHLQDKTCWFPKSKIRLPIRQEGSVNIYIQNWLYDSNVEIPDYAQ